MLKNIIFDFGDIFINLDKEVVARELAKVTDPAILLRLKNLNNSFETGAIDSEQFLAGLGDALPGSSREQLAGLWNAMLLDIPGHRLEFLEQLAANGHYRLFLLSNTNELHIGHVAHMMGKKDYNRFRDCFEGFYLSHEIGMRKPDPGIFRFVLDTHQIEAPETLFIDDSAENISTAHRLGIKTWHLQVGREDVTGLPTKL